MTIGYTHNAMMGYMNYIQPHPDIQITDCGVGLLCITALTCNTPFVTLYVEYWDDMYIDYCGNYLDINLVGCPLAGDCSMTTIDIQLWPSPVIQLQCAVLQ